MDKSYMNGGYWSRIMRQAREAAEAVAIAAHSFKLREVKDSPIPAYAVLLKLDGQKRGRVVFVILPTIS